MLTIPDALANGQVAGVGIPSGPPTGAITKLMAANQGKFTILNITDEQAAKMDGGRSLWTKNLIGKGKKHSARKSGPHI